MRKGEKVFRRPSASVYYCQRKPKNRKNGVGLITRLESFYRANAGGHNYTLRRQSHSSCTTHVIMHNLSSSIHYSYFNTVQQVVAVEKVRFSVQSQSSPSPVLVLSTGGSSVLINYTGIHHLKSDSYPLCSPLPLCSSNVHVSSSYLALLHHRMGLVVF